MKRTLTIMMFAVIVLAADVAPVKMSDASADRFELLNYQERDITRALEEKRAQLREQFTKICREAKIEAANFQALTDICSPDFTKREVTRKEAPQLPAKK